MAGNDGNGICPSAPMSHDECCDYVADLERDLAAARTLVADLETEQARRATACESHVAVADRFMAERDAALRDLAALRDEISTGVYHRTKLAQQIAEQARELGALRERLGEARKLVQAWLLTAWHEEYKLVTASRAFLALDAGRPLRPAPAVPEPAREPNMGLAPAMAGTCCDYDCAGYYEDPKPCDLWPGEERAPREQNGAEPMSDKCVIANFDGMAWPVTGNPLNGLQWRLRYGDHVDSDTLQAAEVINAYGYLLRMSQRERNEMVKKLRAHAMPADGGTEPSR